MSRTSGANTGGGRWRPGSTRGGSDGLERPGRLWAGLDRLGPVWAGLDRAGPVWTGLGRSGPIWADLGRSGPAGTVQSVWTGLRQAGRSRRSGPDGVGPGWAGLDRVRLGRGLARPGLVPVWWPGLTRAARSGSGGSADPGRPDEPGEPGDRVGCRRGWDDSR